jgi:uncharacterized membrane protein YeaQ/YmgE (transglycosylase-associated protein family)
MTPSTPPRYGQIRIGEREVFETVAVWTFLGGLSGFIASKMLRLDLKGLFPNFALGILGALIGGTVSQHVLGLGVTGFNLWSLIISVSGALVILGIVKSIAYK